MNYSDKLFMNPAAFGDVCETKLRVILGFILLLHCIL